MRKEKLSKQRDQGEESLPLNVAEPKYQNFLINMYRFLLRKCWNSVGFIIVGWCWFDTCRSSVVQAAFK